MLVIGASVRARARSFNSALCASVNSARYIFGMAVPPAIRSTIPFL
jgi:hypothetical protein